MNLFLPTFLLVSGLGLGATLHRGQGRPSAPVPAAEDPLRPGPQHVALQGLVGTWDAVIVVEDPSGREQRTRGTLVTKRHTDFHTIDSFEGEFMGMQLVGHGVNGYCTVRKQRFAFWTDSMTPVPMTLYGSYDAKSRELTMTGECFGMSGKLEPCRTVTRYKDDDHYSWTMFGAGPDGKETQHLRIEYTRRK